MARIDEPDGDETRCEGRLVSYCIKKHAMVRREHMGTTILEHTLVWYETFDTEGDADLVDACLRGDRAAIMAEIPDEPEDPRIVRGYAVRHAITE